VNGSLRKETDMSISQNEARDYHAGSRPGKTSVVPTKPCHTQRDLSLADTPGVAVPCLDIKDDPGNAFRYTGKGNLIAVVSNGTAPGKHRERWQESQ